MTNEAVGGYPSHTKSASESITSQFAKIFDWSGFGIIPRRNEFPATFCEVTM